MWSVSQQVVELNGEESVLLSSWLCPHGLWRECCWATVHVQISLKVNILSFDFYSEQITGHFVHPGRLPNMFHPARPNHSLRWSQQSHVSHSFTNLATICPLRCFCQNDSTHMTQAPRPRTLAIQAGQKKKSLQPCFLSIHWQKLFEKDFTTGFFTPRGVHKLIPMWASDEVELL